MQINAHDSQLAHQAQIRLITMPVSRQANHLMEAYGRGACGIDCTKVPHRPLPEGSQWCTGRSGTVQRLVTTVNAGTTRGIVNEICEQIRAQLDQFPRHREGADVILRCNHGKHRSVSFAEVAGACLRAFGYQVQVLHLSCEFLTWGCTCGQRVGVPCANVVRHFMHARGYTVEDAQAYALAHDAAQRELHQTVIHDLQPVFHDALRRQALLQPPPASTRSGPPSSGRPSPYQVEGSA